MSQSYMACPEIIFLAHSGYIIHTTCNVCSHFHITIIEVGQSVCVCVCVCNPKHMIDPLPLTH